MRNRPIIRLEGAVTIYVSDQPAKHAYLTFQMPTPDANGDHTYVIRGGPSNSRVFQGDNPIIVERSVPLSQSRDIRPETDAAREARGALVLDQGDRNPHEIWARMVRVAEDIHQTMTNYRFPSFISDAGGNSNSVVWAILRSVGFGDAQPNEIGSADTLADLLLGIFRTLPGGRPVVTTVQEALNILAEVPDFYPGSERPLTDLLLARINLLVPDVDGQHIGTANRDWLHGGLGNDELAGGSGRDYLFGGVGNDLIVGGAGADHIYGGAGVDTASYVGSSARAGGRLGVVVNLATGTGQFVDAQGDRLSGIENVIGSDFLDILIGDDGANRLEGRDGDDGLIGGAGGDLLIGGAGDDRILGGRGNDTLVGGAGRDLLQGGQGRDVFDVSDSHELDNNPSLQEVLVVADVVIDFRRGLDRLKFSSDVDEVWYQVVSDADGKEGMRVTALDDGVMKAHVFLRGYTDELTSQDFISGMLMVTRFEETFPNSLVGGAARDVLTGGDGNDVLAGRGGDDILRGGAGNDTLIGGSGGDSLYAGPGNDILFGGDGNDYLRGSTGRDIMTGNSGSDVMGVHDTAETFGSADRITDFSGHGGEGDTLHAGYRIPFWFRRFDADGDGDTDTVLYDNVAGDGGIYAILLDYDDVLTIDDLFTGGTIVEIT